MNRALLVDGLGQLGIPADRERIELLERYWGEIELWNPKYGLVHASDDELLVKHFLDSLSGLSVIRELTGAPADVRVDSGSVSAGICDVGSGAGFPGIPLAIFLPGTTVTLVESSGRRVSFLRNAVSVLRLANVRIEERRAEKAAASGMRFPVVTFRAFRPLEPDILRVLFGLKTREGWIAAYKGRRERVDEELGSVRGMFSEVRSIPVAVPFLEEERTIVLLR